MTPLRLNKYSQLGDLSHWLQHVKITEKNTIADAMADSLNQLSDQNLFFYTGRLTKKDMAEQVITVQERPLSDTHRVFRIRRKAHLKTDLIADLMVDLSSMKVKALSIYSNYPNIFIVASPEDAELWSVYFKKA